MQSVHDPARKRDAKGELNPNPKWDVPFELIEWQPAYAQLGAIGEGGGAWQEDWQHTDSSKITYLLGKLRAIEALPPSDWNPNDWGNASSSSACIWPPPVANGCRPSKAIVFTQYAIHARLLINRIKEPYPEGCVKTFHRNMTIQEKADSLKRFEVDPLCRVLIMDQSGSHGLDLSFVHYVFLMEPIINKSLEEQVVSRAWRLGASKNQVHAEVLAMRGTYEEDILWRTGHLPIEKRGVEEEGGGEGDDGASVGASSGDAASGIDSAGYANESKRQFAARRIDRNAYLKGLKSVLVG